jgi:hypothetical protein
MKIWVKNASTRKEVPRRHIIYAARYEREKGIITAFVIKTKGWGKTVYVLLAGIGVGDVQSASLHVHQTQIQASLSLRNISSFLLLNIHGHWETWV